MIGDGRFKRYRQEFDLREPDDPIGPYVLLSVEDTETHRWAQVALPAWEVEAARFDLTEWEYARLIDQLRHDASDRVPAHRAAGA